MTTPEPPPSRRVSWALDHPRAAVALPLVALAMSVFVLASSIVATGRGDDQVGGIVFWAAATLISALVVRHRLRVLRDPEAERDRLERLRRQRHERG